MTSPNQSNLKLNVSALDKGGYMVRIDVNGTVETKKLIEK